MEAGKIIYNLQQYSVYTDCPGDLYASIWIMIAQNLHNLELTLWTFNTFDWLL